MNTVHVTQNHTHLMNTVHVEQNRTHLMNTVHVEQTSHIGLDPLCYNNFGFVTID